MTNLLSAKEFGMDMENPFPELLTLHNTNGLVAQFTNYGARWVSMWTPDRNGNLSDIILGFDTIDGYLTAGERYHGAIVGRVCGRISNARFKIREQEYLLASNDAYGTPVRNHLHGGIDAFHNRFWKSRLSINTSGEESVVFSCLSADGEEGYPGNLSVEVTYTLRNTNLLSMECRAICDKPTPVNLTNHTFFNLRGGTEPKNVLSHSLQINAPSIIECDEELIPTGRLISVEGTSLDFRSSRVLRDSLREKHSQIIQDKGFSIAFALDESGKGLRPAAELTDKVSGRVMRISTNQPSLQVYTGYFMDGTDLGKGGEPYYANAGLALETQGFPDAVNRRDFPSIIIKAGEIYRHTAEYQFDLIKE